MNPDDLDVMGGISDFAGGTLLRLSPRNPRVLRRIKCQPDIDEGEVALPDGVEVLGIDSGVLHASGADTLCQTLIGAELGATIPREKIPNVMRAPDGELYLANIGSDIWRAVRESVPESLDHKGHKYLVRLSTEHPIYEAERVRRFADLLRATRENLPARAELLRAAGELMIQSHFSYGHRCGLDSPETDLIVQLARKAGPDVGIYGARVSGRGAGGVVVMLVDRARNPDVDTTIQSIRADYEMQSGHGSRLVLPFHSAP